MNSDKRKQIIDEHPNLYPNGMSFACEDGWLDIIHSLSKRLEHLIIDLKSCYPDTPKDFIPYCTQVKEKHGGLRLYMSCETAEMSEEIENAKAQSLAICEICGAPGKLNKGSWYRTLCEDHAES